MNECMNCSKLFVPCRNSQGKYCSRSCSASRNNKLFPKRQPGPTARKKAKPAVQKWLDGEWDGTVKSGLSSAIRRHLIEQAGEKCEQCGWSGVNPKSGKTTLTVDHTDGDSKNNRAENLKVLCPNCHSLTPTYGALNKGNGRSNRY